MDIRKWLFYNGSKDHAWIVYQNLEQITTDSKYHGLCNPLKNRDQIQYIHAIEMDLDNLTCLLETADGFYLIRNEKKTIEVKVEESEATVDGTEVKVEEVEEEVEVKKMVEINPTDSVVKGPKTVVESNIYFYGKLEECLKSAPKNLLGYLRIIKAKNMKFNQAQTARKIFPYHFAGVAVEQKVKLLDEIIDVDGGLDLSFNFALCGDDLVKFETSRVINKLILNENFQIRDFKWCQSNWTQNLNWIEIANMPHFIDASLEKIFDSLPKLSKFYVHFCPQVTIRCLKALLKRDQLNMISLNCPSMICQPNAYSSLISEEEWNVMGNRSVEKILINSTNMSLDLIDYIRNCCKNLKYLVLDEKIFNDVRQNLGSVGNLNETEFYMVSSKGHRIKLGRDFILQNLLRQNFQRPFSDSMSKIINRIREQEERGFEDEIEDEMVETSQ